MNERVPDSSGLPLRAMVMVLLFLGVVFLLVGFQAMGGGDGDSSDDDTSVPTVAVDHLGDPDVGAQPAPQGRCPGVQHLRSGGCGRPDRHPAAGGRLERHRDRKPAAARCHRDDGVLRRGRRRAAGRRGGGQGSWRHPSNRESRKWPSSHRASSCWSQARLCAMVTPPFAKIRRRRPVRRPRRPAERVRPTGPGPATSPGTTPSIWTGSPAPSARTARKAERAKGRTAPRAARRSWSFR